VAHYTATVKQYTISFINYDNTPLQSTLVEYGTTPAYTGETPVKPNTDQYTYTFNGWDPAVADVTGIATYTAQFSSSVNQYTVTFYDEDGTTILQQSKWDYDATPAYQKENPTKAGDAQYSYTFAGWGNGIQSVTGDTSYVAKYTQTVNQYTVEFYADEAKTQKLYSNEFYFGSTPAYEGATPTKEGDAQYSYTFAGWGTDGIKTVTADTAYVAQFTQSVNKYTVEFYADEDKTQKLYSNQFEYGATPTYSGETPTKEGDAQYSYTFAGWGTDGLKTVTADTAYIAQFTSSVNKYAITFEVKGNPSLNYTVNDVPYGTVVNDLAELVKAALGNTFEDDNYIYTYAGLEDVTPDDIVTGTATYYVLYTAEPKVISGFDQVGDAARATKVVENGVIYILRDGKKYNLTGAEVK